MKKFLPALLILFSLQGFTQGVHYQFHRDALAPVFYQFNSDSIYQLVKVANVSNYNAIGVVNLNTESWSYITSPTLTYNLIANNPIAMKNKNEGIVFQSTQVQATSNNWQTVSTHTIPGLTLSGSSPFGYYGYSINGATFTTQFSANGINWTSVHSGTTLPRFAKTKTKIFTIHNNQFKVSNNGGATYSVVNPTLNTAGLICAPNNDTLFIASTQIMRSFDGGITWSAVTTPSGNISYFNCKNGKEIMILNSSSSPKTIHYSNNSGTSWTTYTNLPASYVNEPLLANENGFYLYPSFKSSNGATWNNFLPISHANKPYNVSATGNIVLAGYAQGYFGYSTNRGFNFTFPPNKVPSAIDVMAVKAVNINKFFVADRKGQIFVSTDQGSSWTQKTNSTFNNIGRKFTISQNTNTVVLSCLGTAYISSDGGNTFNFITATNGGAHFQTLKPTSGQVIDVGGIFPSPAFSLSAWQFYTINGSGAATPVSSISCLSTEEIIDIHMKDDNTGYFMTRNSATNETLVYKTTNGWVSTSTIAAIPSPTASARAYDGRTGTIHTFGNDTVIISGSGNPTNNQTTFYHLSSDGGQTWSVVYPTFNNPTAVLGNQIYKMEFLNSKDYIALISNNFSGSIQASVGVYLNSSSAGSGGGSIGITEYLHQANRYAISLYPNPAQDRITVNLQRMTSQNLTIRLFTLTGQEVLKSEITQNGQSIEIGHLAPGLYIVDATDGSQHYSTKLIKR